MKDGHLEKIKTKGFWRVHFQPVVSKVKLNPLGECRKIVAKNSINLTGWDYPHVPEGNVENAGIDAGESYYQGWIEWEDYGHIEFWRMYQSGQFIHYFGLIEDWKPGTYRNMWEQNDREPQSGEVLGISRSIYFITNIYQFLSRLVQDGLYDEGVKVSISLNNTRDRGLLVDHHSRVPLSYPRKADIEKIEYSSTLLSKNAILSETKELTVKTIVYFFERFKWDPPNIEMIKVDYDNLIKGKI